MKPYVAAGLTVLAGAALFEVALVPGLVIGGAAVVLAPRYLPKGSLRRLRRSVQTLARKDVPRQTAAQASRPQPPQADGPRSILPKFAIGQAVAKTITFRIIVTSLDFTVNYVVIGELATAAGLSTFNMIAGPLFYLGHEAAWNYFGPADRALDLATLTRRRPDGEIAQGGWRSFTISRALAKTITFRTLATIMDFATNYVVVRDVTQAVILSSSGFILGPFVYYGHEKAWDYFGPKKTLEQPAPLLLPAPR
jgi:uncharacterized membrane protein